MFCCCRLCVKDPYQLYQRLEQQAREYVLEMKVRLLKHLSGGSKPAGPPGGAVAAAQGPPQAHQFVSLLLEEYNALCQAARTISSFLLTLVSFPPAAHSAGCWRLFSLLTLCSSPFGSRRMSTCRSFRWRGSCTTSTFLRTWCSLNRSCKTVYQHLLHSWSKILFLSENTHSDSDYNENDQFLFKYAMSLICY